MKNAKMNLIIKNVKSFFKITGIITICIVGAIFYGLFIYKTPFMKSQSPNKNYEITVKYISPFFFGKHEMYVYYKQKEHIFHHKLLHTSLGNDGGMLRESNCLIQWKNENELNLIFKGCEQFDEKFDIFFNKNDKKIEILRSQNDLTDDKIILVSSACKNF